MTIQLIVKYKILEVMIFKDIKKVNKDYNQPSIIGLWSRRFNSLLFWTLQVLFSDIDIEFYSG